MTILGSIYSKRQLSTAHQSGIAEILKYFDPSIAIYRVTWEFFFTRIISVKSSTKFNIRNIFLSTLCTCSWLFIELSIKKMIRNYFAVGGKVYQPISLPSRVNTIPIGSPSMARDVHKNHITEFLDGIFPKWKSYGPYIGLRLSAKKASFSNYCVLKKTLTCYTYAKKIDFSRKINILRNSFFGWKSQINIQTIRLPFRKNSN
jgi:hypothetical protein